MFTENSPKPENTSINKISVDQPAVYMIRVMGKLNKS